MSKTISDPERADLRLLQLFFLAAAVFVVSVGYGALMPLLPESSAYEIARHVGFPLQPQ